MTARRRDIARRQAQNAPMTRWPIVAAETVLGLVLAATPVAMWIAWEPEILLAVLATSLVCAALLILVHRLDARSTAPSWQRPALDDRFFVEMHRVFPLVHHHRRTESARFREAMRRVRRLVP